MLRREGKWAAGEVLKQSDFRLSYCYVIVKCQLPFLGSLRNKPNERLWMPWIRYYFNQVRNAIIALRPPPVPFLFHNLAMIIGLPDGTSGIGVPVNPQ